MNYSNDVKYIISAEARNGAWRCTNRYIGLYFDSNGEINDFSIFYTVDGYLDSHKVYMNQEDAKRDLNMFKDKYNNMNNRRYDSLKNLKIKSIIGIQATL